MSLIKQSLLTTSKYGVKCPYTMNPIGICIHNTANDASAKNEIAYMKSNNNQTSYHIAVDDVEAIQAIPFNRNAWASGDGKNGQGNRKYIHIEICYSKSGGTRFNNAEKLASKVVAELLNKFGWGINNIKAHRDFANKNCPHRTNMTEFKKMVQAELGNQIESNQLYKVNTDVLNIRQGAGTSYKIVGTVKKGEVYTIVEVNGKWGKLKSGIGWIHLGYCKEV